MTAALSLAEQGFPVHLVERSDRLGGNLHHVHYTLDDLGLGHNVHEAEGCNGHGPQEYLTRLINRLQADPLITIHTNTELAETSGFVGNFTSILQPNANGGERQEFRHGVTILTTGGVEYRGDEYGYGSDSRILTQQEFEKVLAGWATGQEGNGAVEQQGDGAEGQRVDEATEKTAISELVAPSRVDLPIGNPLPNHPLPDSVAMILCVGPAEEYCSRICCTTALKNALMLKRLKPAAQVTVIYRDIRTYGFKEKLYNQAREAGVLFVHYDFDRKPEVINENGRLTVRV